MLIGLSYGGGYGSQPGAWRMPGVDPKSYDNFDVVVKHAQAAERGKLHFLFLPDGFGRLEDIENAPPIQTLDVMLTLGAIARETKHIGLLATGSTTFNEPYNLARQFKALDVMSHGRAGWNAITSRWNLNVRNSPPCVLTTVNSRKSPLPSSRRSRLFVV